MMDETQTHEFGLGETSSPSWFGFRVSFASFAPNQTRLETRKPRSETHVWIGSYAEHYESIEGLSALKSCPRLKKAEFWRIEEVNDLSFLSACLALEYLDISKCPRITDLAPLSNLNNLKQLICFDIFPEASVLPLTSCAGLKILKCNEDAADLDELRRRKPGLELTLKKRW